MGDELADQVGPAQRHQQGDDAAVAPADQVGRTADDRLEDTDGLGGHVVVVERIGRVRGPPMAAAVEGHDPPRGGERVTHAVEQQGAVGEPTVQEEHGLLPAAPLLHPGRVPVDVHVDAHGRRAYAGRAPVDVPAVLGEWASGRRGCQHRAQRSRRNQMTQRDVTIPTPDGTCDAGLTRRTATGRGRQ